MLGPPKELWPTTLAVVILCSSACNRDAIEVSTSYDKSVDFAAFHSFFVVTADPSPGASPPPAAYNEINRAAVVSAVTFELSDLGLAQVGDRSEADVVAVPYVNQSSYVDYRVYYPNYWGPSYWGYGWGRGYGGYGYGGYPRTVPVRYEVGNLLIDVVRPTGTDGVAAPTDQLVFSGTAEAVVRGSGANLLPLIDDAVQRIFAEWPSATNSPVPSTDGDAGTPSGDLPNRLPF